MAPWAARTPELRWAAGSPAVRRPSSPYSPAPDSSATRRIAGDHIFSPPAFFLPVSLRAWPIDAAARVFPWAWALRVFRPALPLASAPGVWEAAVAAVWPLPAPAHRPAVKQP